MDEKNKKNIRIIYRHIYLFQLDQVASLTQMAHLLV